MENGNNSEERIPLLPQVKIVDREVLPDKEQSDHRLDRSLSTSNGIFIMVGILIGSGVFVSPGLVVKRTPNLFTALLIWIVCGLMIISAMSVAIELGFLFPRPGSIYVYIQRTLGRIPAFMFIWTYSTIVAPSGFAVLLNTLGRYATQPFSTDPNFIWVSKSVGAVVVIVLCIINSYGIKVIAKFQSIFTGIQVLIITLVVAMGIWQASITGDLSNFEPSSFFNNTNKVLEPEYLREIGKAMYNTLWAYDGWMFIASLTEEFINPQKSLPVVAFTSSLFSIFVYIVLNLAYFAVLSKQEMGVADTVGIALVEKVAGKKATIIMPILVALTILATLNGGIVGISRVYLSAARDGSLPRCLSLIHAKRKSPVLIIWLICLSSLFWLFVVKTTEDLIQYFNCGFWVFYGMTFLGCLVHKFKFKEVELLPYKTFKITPLFLCFVSLAMLIAGFIGQPLETGICWMWILSSLVVYYVFIYKQFLPCKCLSHLNDLLKQKYDMIECQ